jgi:hypothetical protein
MALRLCYLVTCRIFGLLGSRRRTALDKDIELMVLRHEVRVLKRQLHGRVRYRPAVLDECVRHYNQARPHRGLQLAHPIPHPVTACRGGAITRRDILGGVVHEYERAA